MGNPLDDVTKTILKGTNLAIKRDLLQKKIDTLAKDLKATPPSNGNYSKLVKELIKATADLPKVIADHAKVMQTLAKQASKVGS